MRFIAWGIIKVVSKQKPKKGGGALKSSGVSKN
jgi:hypothetical protein